MKKRTQNFAVDALAFIAFILLAGTGVLMKYTLPPGTGHFRTIWGLDRHEWGQIHFWISVSLIVLIVIHLLLHWRWIFCMIKGKPESGTRLRIGVALVALVALSAIVAAPFLSPIEEIDEPLQRGREHETAVDHEHSGLPSAAPDEIEESESGFVRDTESHSAPEESGLRNREIRGTGQGLRASSVQGRARNTSPLGATDPDERVDDIGIEVRGYTTLRDLERQTGLSYSLILEGLGLPTDIAADEQLGRLRREHGFTMSDVQEVISAHLAAR